MAQTPASKLHSAADNVPYTPAVAVTAGDVVELGSDLNGIAMSDIAADALGSLDIMGCFRLPKVTGAIALWDQVFWDANGTPVTGDTTSGAASATSSVGAFIGWCILAAESGDSYVNIVKIPQAYVVGTG